MSDTGLPASPDQPLDSPPAEDDLIGPDYVFGFGLVQPVAADDLARGGHFVTDVIENGYIDYPITVTPEMLDAREVLQVTLVWDDPPYSLHVTPPEGDTLLQNDLDLVLIDPQGRRHFPWRLDPDDPAKPASQASHDNSIDPRDDAAMGDRHNTVEQISITPDDDQLGKTWRIRVAARRLGLPPQSFTLASSIIWPDAACATIAREPGLSPTVEQPDTLRWILLIVALVILALLLLWLAEVIYRRFEPDHGRDYALGMIALAYLMVFVIALLLWQWLTR